MNRKRIASGVSALLNAPLLTLFTFIPIIIISGTRNTLHLIGITSFFGCFFPLLGVFVMLKKKIIKDFYATDRETRIKPFMWSIFSYLLGFCFLYYYKAPIAVTALMACYVVNGIVLFAITLKWKISIHASGITSPITALIYILGRSMLPFLLLVLPVAWARLELKAHNKLQVTAGAIISSLLTWIQMFLYVNYHLLLQV
jgi:membrane-associated phospholipid phosphatase